MCHQQKASPRIRLNQTNHLCKFGKTAILELSPAALQHYFFFPFKMFSQSEQFSETYLIESSPHVLINHLKFQKI